MNLSQLVTSLTGALNRATDDRYEQAVGAVVRPDGYGILSDRLVPGLSTGRVGRRQLAEIVKNVSTLRPEFVEQNADEIINLIKKLEKRDGHEDQDAQRDN